MFGLIFIFSLLLLYSNAGERETPPEQGVAIKSNVRQYARPIVLDAENFTDLVTRSKLFIDNTKILDEIIMRLTHPNFITFYGPENWGKSMTIGMLKSFFELTFTKIGQKIPRESTDSHKFFLKGEVTLANGSKGELRKPPIIGRDWLHMRYQGKHPVIHIDFKDAVGENATVIKEKMYAAIKRAFEPYKFLLTMPRWYDMRYSVLYLCDRLSDHVRELHIVVLLIENYDTPILNFLQNDKLPREDMYEIIRFLKDLMPYTFHVRSDDESCLFRGIVTGRFSFEQHNYDEEFFILNKTGESFMEYFGINHQNVQLLFNKSKLDKDLEEQAYKWYGGYDSLFSNQTFYNPLAISKFLWLKELGIYSKSESDYNFLLKLFKRYPQLAEDVLSLISQQTVDISDKLGLSFEYKPQMRHVFDNEKFQPRPTYDRLQFFSYLVQDGVLVKIPDTGKAKLPNIEMTCLLVRHLMMHYKRLNHIHEKQLKSAAEIVTHFVGSVVTTTAVLQDVLNDFYNDSRTSCNITSLTSVFNALLLRTQDELHYEIEIFYNKIYKADYVTVHRGTKLAVIIVLQQNSTAENALNAAHECKSALDTFGQMTTTKFLGINIASNHTVQVLAKVESLVL